LASGTIWQEWVSKTPKELTMNDEKMQDVPNDEDTAADADVEDCRASGEQRLPNPFAPAALRLGQNFNEGLRVKTVVTNVPVGRPPRHAYFRVRRGEDNRLATALLELKDENKTYIISRDLWQALAGELVQMVLYQYITKQGVVGIWPVKLPNEEGRLDSWNESKLEAARLAEESWVRLRANMPLKAYEIMIAEGCTDEPDWPEDLTFDRALELAFRDSRIDDIDDPILKNLRGEF